MDYLSAIWGIAGVVVIIIAGLVIAAGIIGGYLWWSGNRKFSQYKTLIFSEDGMGNITLERDNAGIFVDKVTQNKRFFLKRHNVGLDANKVRSFTLGKEKIVFLRKRGLKNFSFLDFTFPHDRGIELEVTEEDVNWSINAYERQKKAFQWSLLKEWLPYISIGIVSMVMLIMFIYLFQKMDVIKDAAVALRDAAQILADSKAATVLK